MAARAETSSLLSTSGTNADMKRMADAPPILDRGLEVKDANAPPILDRGLEVNTANAPPILDRGLKADAPPLGLSADAPPILDRGLEDDGTSASNKARSTDAATTSDGENGLKARALNGNAAADEAPAADAAWYDIRSPLMLKARDETTTADEPAWYDVRSPLNLEAKDDTTADGPAWYDVRSPLNLEAKDDAPAVEAAWYDVRTPLNLEAKEAGAGQVVSTSEDAAQPWYNIRSALSLEAHEAKHLGTDAGGQQLEALAGSDQLHLLVGGSLLLVAGVVVNFVRRARQRKAAEKALEDETYALMA